MWIRDVSKVPHLPSFDYEQNKGLYLLVQSLLFEVPTVTESDFLMTKTSATSSKPLSIEQGLSTTIVRYNNVIYPELEIFSAQNRFWLWITFSSLSRAQTYQKRWRFLEVAYHLTIMSIGVWPRYGNKPKYWSLVKALLLLVMNFQGSAVIDHLSYLQF